MPLYPSWTSAGFEPAGDLICFGLQHFRSLPEYVRGIRPLCQLVRDFRKNPLYSTVGLEPTRRLGLRSYVSCVCQFRHAEYQWQGQDLNLRPLAYEANELPSATTPLRWYPVVFHNIKLLQKPPELPIHPYRCASPVE